MGFMSNPAGGDGNFTVYVKYNAKAGRWYTKEDKPEATEYEVTNMTAMFDIPNIRTGWFLFAAGVAPAKTFDPSLARPHPSRATVSSAGSSSRCSATRTWAASASSPRLPAP
jgi:hypothetical protein